MAAQAAIHELSFCMTAYVYILASDKDGVLYIGVTSDLVKRVSEHKLKIHKGFTSRYAVDKLVWYAAFEDIDAAIQCETQMKKWKRSWKVRRILEINPEWHDLFENIL